MTIRAVLALSAGVVVLSACAASLAEAVKTRMGVAYIAMIAALSLTDIALWVVIAYM